MTSSKRTNSRQKGKRGEREAAKVLSEVLGVPARRGQQFKGTPDSPDVEIDLDGIFVEVKYAERVNLYEALERAEQQAGAKVPIVLWRRNRKPWLFVCYLEDLRTVWHTLYERVPTYLQTIPPNQTNTVAAG
jgi:Holliday junction resolvase